jgi:GTP-binding protein LepA
VLEELGRPRPAARPATRTRRPRALIFDSEFDQYRGVIAYIRVVDGSFRKGEAIRAMAAGHRGRDRRHRLLHAAQTPADGLRAGEVGYLITGIKDVTKLRVGDTLTTKAAARPSRCRLSRRQADGVLRPVPDRLRRLPELRDALEKLTLNDAALSWEPETSDALGFGFRCGFLGLLHMDIVRERLEREYDLELMATMPSVEFEVTLTDGLVLEVHNPTDMPDPARIAEVARAVHPRLDPDAEGVHRPDHGALPGAPRRARRACTTCPSERVQLTTTCRWPEIVLDFFDQLKSRTRGYASLDYEPLGLRASNLGQARRAARRRPGRRAARWSCTATRPTTSARR